MRKRVFKTFAAAALATTIAGTTIIGSTAFADEISTLTQQKQDKQNELDQLQQQAAYLLTEMSSLEQDMADLSDEIDQTNADLEAAQQLQQKQFDDTKLRIKYMYEDQSTSISDVFNFLLSSLSNKLSSSSRLLFSTSSSSFSNSFLTSTFAVSSCFSSSSSFCLQLFSRIGSASRKLSIR